MEGIQESEGLWRDVYRERQKRAWDCPAEERPFSKHTKAVFGTPRRPNARVSTSLYDRVSLEFATAEGDRRASLIEGSKGVEGWVVINAGDGSQGGRQVVPTPTDDNPYHAEILIPDEHLDSWEDAEVHLRAFVSLGRWQDRANALC